MASVYRPKGRKKYRVEYIDASGQRRIVPGYRDKAASEALGRQLERDAERERAGLPVADRAQRRRPLQEAIDEYVLAMETRGRARCHRQESRRHLETLQRACGWTCLDDVPPDGLHTFLTKLMKQGRSARTLNSYRDTLHTFLEWCVRPQFWLQENPLKGYPKAKYGAEAQRRPKRALTPDEFAALLALDLGDRHLLYLVAGLSCLRRNEQRQLQPCDLTPTVPSPTWHLRPEITKGRRRDVVPMLPEAAAAIRPLWEATPQGRRLFPEWPRHQTFDKDLRRAGIPKVDAQGRFVSYHSLRYFFCTLVGRQLPIQLVRLLMRHRDIRTTCNLYMDLGLTDVNEAVLKLPKLWDDAAGDRKSTA